MKKQYFKAITLGLAFMSALTASAQDMEFLGVKSNARYDDGETAIYNYVGWDAETGTAIFTGDQGLWKLNYEAENDTVKAAVEHYDNLMYGNSGAFYMNGTLYTIMSHEDPSTETAPGTQEFVVRKWNAETYELLETKTFPSDKNLESRGMAYNPKDGKVYGLFHLTGVELPVPEEELDQEDLQEGYTSDAGYALCTIDLTTMELTQITPGIYYDNFIFLAISPEGRIFSMTSGGMLVEFDENGLMKTNSVQATDPVTGEEYTEQQNIFPNCGYVSQFKRQAACFDYTTGKLYWNGFRNSGMGINDWGSWSTLSDKEWRTNGKYDTALYEIDTNTGAATRLSLIPNRVSLACMWIPGKDATDVLDATTGIKNINPTATTGGTVQVYNQAGQLVFSGNKANMNLQKGFYIVKEGNKTEKVMVK